MHHLTLLFYDTQAMAVVKIHITDQKGQSIRDVSWKTSKTAEQAKAKISAVYGHEGALREGDIDLEDDEMLELGSTCQLIAKTTGVNQTSIWLIQ